MKKLKYYNIYVLFLVLFFSCLHGKDIDDATLSFDKVSIMSKGHILYETPCSGWRIKEGNARIDNTDLYNNKASLIISPDTICRSQVCFLLNVKEIDANRVVFSGKYKADKVNEAEDVLIFSISRLDRARLQTTDSIIIRLKPQDTAWAEFQVTSLIDKDNSEFINFGISSVNSAPFRISDCKASINNQPLAQIINTKYGAEKDTEFDKGSNVQLEELTPQVIDNLEVLGRVWGFLKYYHPEVTQGKYNWDYELFRVIQEIANAKNKEERDNLLNKWIDKYGKIIEIANYAISDSTQYSRIINLDWINNIEMFDKDLILKLNRIKNAKRSNKFNYYAVLYEEKVEDVQLIREKTYENIEWSDQGFRILSLFRLWNAIEYCFPYTDYTDTPWSILLKTFISDFYLPESKAEYELSIMKLAACINDSHGYVYIPNNSLDETVLAPIYKSRYTIPVELIRSIEGNIVVKSTESNFLNKGDVILSINEKDVKAIINEMSSYIIASNENGLIRNIVPYLLSSENSSMNISILRDGERKKLNINNFSRIRSKLTSNVSLDSSIAYISTLYSPSQIDSVMQEKEKHIKGIIIDLRGGVLDVNSLFLIAKYLFGGSMDNPLWISMNEKEHTGNYRFYPQNNIDLPISKDYTGKIAILVDEKVQSLLESWTMIYSLAPQSVVVGRQTAGANGNICRINLPGGIVFQYTQLGAYYPSWEILQRKGVKIDIPVSPTVQDIKLGRDVWIENAIEYIK